MKTNGGFRAECEECGVTETFATQLQRQRWVFRYHIGHTIWMWRDTEVRI